MEFWVWTGLILIGIGTGVAALVYTVMNLWVQLNAGSRRPRHRWEYNIKMDLQEVGSGAWTGLICLKIEAVDMRL